MKFFLFVLTLFAFSIGLAKGIVQTVSQKNLKTVPTANVQVDDKISNATCKTTQYINRLKLMQSLNLHARRNPVQRGTSVPIKDGMIYLLFAGAGLAFYMFYKYEDKVSAARH